MNSTLTQFLEPLFDQRLRSVAFVGVQSCCQGIDLFTHCACAHGHVLGVEFHVARLDAFR